MGAVIGPLGDAVGEEGLKFLFGLLGDDVGGMGGEVVVVGERLEAGVVEFLVEYSHAVCGGGELVVVECPYGEVDEREPGHGGCCGVEGFGE